VCYTLPNFLKNGLALWLFSATVSEIYWLRYGIELQNDDSVMGLAKIICIIQGER